MNLNKLHYGPHVEGFIRVAAERDGTGKLVFTGGMEILARHHDQQKVDPVSGQPRLANHPLQEKLVGGADKKITEVPIRMFFDKTKNAIKAGYVAYGANDAPVCRGDGSVAKYSATDELGQHIVSERPCPGNESCSAVQSGEVRCKRMVSMTVQIANQENPFSVFEVRTSSYNSLKALRGQLEMIESRFGGLRHIPIKLEVWQSSNGASEYESFDLFKINIDCQSEIEAMKTRKRALEDETLVGLATNPDEAYEKVNADPLDLAHCDSFTEVRDFYLAAGSAATARVGSESRKMAVVQRAAAKQVADVFSASVTSVARNKQEEGALALL